MADILILANSRKKGGFCVAGKDIASNKWVRIVGDKNGKELDLSQVAYNDLAGERQMAGFEPLYKFIRINLGKAVPLYFQPENRLITKGIWQEIQAEQYNILPYDTPVDLWGEGDRIPSNEILNGSIVITQSLYMIKVDELHLHNTFYGGKMQRRINFVYNNTNYDLAATMDNKIFDAIQNNQLQHSNILVISLGEEYQRDGCHYKLAAAIF